PADTPLRVLGKAVAERVEVLAPYGIDVARMQLTDSGLRLHEISHPVLPTGARCDESRSAPAQSQRAKTSANLQWRFGLPAAFVAGFASIRPGKQPVERPAEVLPLPELQEHGVDVERIARRIHGLEHRI